MLKLCTIFVGEERKALGNCNILLVLLYDNNVAGGLQLTTIESVDLDPRLIILIITFLFNI